jgi:nitrite reductase/ring-hydroxylating ferredoxin subunit
MIPVRAARDRLLFLCEANAVNESEPLRVEGGGNAYAVFKLASGYFVTADACTHGPGSLSEGMVLGEEIECPFHQGRFHIPSGRPVAPPCSEPVRCWTAHVIDGHIMIDPDEQH